jgi:uncharacterized protein DUF1707
MRSRYGDRVDSSSPVDPKELRVSDAERQHVVELLNRAVGHGLLSLDEFTQRTDVALQARTRGDLNAVLIDLPGLTVAGGEIGPVKETLELHQTASSMQRRGRWNVPRRISLRNRLGSMVLDFSEAVIPHREVTIQIDNELGSVTMILPEGSTLDADELRLTMSGFTNKVRAQEVRGSRHFVLTGRVTTGSLTVTVHRKYRVGPFLVHRPFRISRAR